MPDRGNKSVGRSGNKLALAKTNRIDPLIAMLKIQRAAVLLKSVRLTKDGRL
jgi:hypothetical protein